MCARYWGPQCDNGRTQRDVMDVRFLAFVAVSALLILAPGPDMALVARNALRSGWPIAAATAWGVATGILGWAIAAVLGVATLLAESAAFFTLVKMAGAVYLIYLGVRSLQNGLVRPHHDDSADVPRVAAMPLRLAFQQGLLGNLLNPKAAVIFVTVVPQFIRHGDTPLRLGLMVLVFELLLVSWLNLYGYVLSRVGQSRTGVRLRRRLQTVSGVVLMSFGVRLALESR